MSFCTGGTFPSPRSISFHSFHRPPPEGSVRCKRRGPISLLGIFHRARVRHLQSDYLSSSRGVERSFCSHPSPRLSMRIISRVLLSPRMLLRCWSRDVHPPLSPRMSPDVPPLPPSPCRVVSRVRDVLIVRGHTSWVLIPKQSLTVCSSCVLLLEPLHQLIQFLYNLRYTRSNVIHPPRLPRACAARMRQGAQGRTAGGRGDNYPP